MASNGTPFCSSVVRKAPNVGSAPVAESRSTLISTAGPFAAAGPHVTSPASSTAAAPAAVRQIHCQLIPRIVISSLSSRRRSLAELDQLAENTPDELVEASR